MENIGNLHIGKEYELYAEIKSTKIGEKNEKNKSVR
jgi:hypothetical protein